MNTYETVAGSKPNADEQHEPRTIQHTDPAGALHMMTEIGDGTFVQWSNCKTCSKRVAECTCASGPTEPEFMQRWRDERFTRSFDRRGAEPALPALLRHRDRRVAAVIRFLLARGYKIEAPATQKPKPTEVEPSLDEEGFDDSQADEFVENQADEARLTRHDERVGDDVDTGLDAALEQLRAVREARDDVGF